MKSTCYEAHIQASKLADLKRVKEANAEATRAQALLVYATAK